jgi:nucleotide-binding universal stress UspA family protein
VLYRNILVAIDGSIAAKAALEHALELARDQHARLTLMTVVPPVAAVAVAGSAQVVPLQEACFNDALNDAVASVPDDVGLLRILAHGKPAREIVQRVESGDYDLIVMGTHGRGRVGEAVVGSVSREVVHRSRTPVLLVRGQAQPVA